jgi:hypothetical protein
MVLKMVKAVATDEEFISAWNRFKGASKVSEFLGVTERNVHLRRRSLEKKLKIKLEAAHHNARAYEGLQTHHLTKARHQAGITTGTVIVFSDAHFWPGLRTTAYKGLLWAISEFKPYAVINNGDAFDGASISRFPRIGWTQQPSVKEELYACQESLAEIEAVAKAARHNVQLIWPLGNHDSRFENFLAANAGGYEGVAGFSLKDHFPAWKPCWSCWLTDGVVVKHRYKNGIHATHNNATGSGVSIVTGHLHSLKVTPFTDYTGTRYGVDTGTLADIDGKQFNDYLEDNPVNWRSGFAVLTFNDGRLLWPELASKHAEGLLDFRGQLIDVSAI